MQGGSHEDKEYQPGVGGVVSLEPSSCGVGHQEKICIAAKDSEESELGESGPRLTSTQVKILTWSNSDLLLISVPKDGGVHSEILGVSSNHLFLMYPL